MRWKPIRESSPVKGKGQDNMARIFKEPDAPLFAKQAYSGLIGRRCASLCLHMWRGCRSSTCLHGTHQATGVQVPPTLSAVVLNAERSKPVSSPGIVQAGETVRHTVGEAGKRCRKKRMPFGNRMDTDYIRRESEQTSGGCLVARESGEPLNMGKQKTAPHCGTGALMDETGIQLIRRLWMRIAKVALVTIQPGNPLRFALVDA